MPLQFHALAFEGPDAYARAGGIASRISGLSQAIARAGFRSHLWFVGHPGLRQEETRRGVELHRWCQWISAHHPLGVYDGEEGKRSDYARSLPSALCDRYLGRLRETGDLAVVLAEEWHTAEAVVRLHEELCARGVRDRVCLLWNANNHFGFDRIDWGALSRAATITTVSRYMKHRMAARGIEAVALPNGIDPAAFVRPDPAAIARFRARVEGRLVLAKIARFDPDKRWIAAVEIAADLVRRGLRPLLVARGGLEAHGGEVLARAAELGLRVARRELRATGVDGLVEALRDLEDVEVVLLDSNVDPRAKRLLLSQADLVLANSGHEPFGLVGLETMAVSGLAVTGCTGEDYAEAGRNAVVLQGADPAELVSLWLDLRRDGLREIRMRREGRAVARRYRWREILRLHLLPRIALAGGPAFAAELAGLARRRNDLDLLREQFAAEPRQPLVREVPPAAADVVPLVLVGLRVAGERGA